MSRVSLSAPPRLMALMTRERWMIFTSPAELVLATPLVMIGLRA